MATITHYTPGTHGQYIVAHHPTLVGQFVVTNTNRRKYGIAGTTTHKHLATAYAQALRLNVVARATWGPLATYVPKPAPAYATAGLGCNAPQIGGDA